MCPTPEIHSDTLILFMVKSCKRWIMPNTLDLKSATTYAGIYTFKIWPSKLIGPWPYACLILFCKIVYGLVEVPIICHLTAIILPKPPGRWIPCTRYKSLLLPGTTNTDFPLGCCTLEPSHYSGCHEHWPGLVQVKCMHFQCHKSGNTVFISF